MVLPTRRRVEGKELKEVLVYWIDRKLRRKYSLFPVSKFPNRKVINRAIHVANELLNNISINVTQGKLLRETKERKKKWEKEKKKEQQRTLHTPHNQRSKANTIKIMTYNVRTLSLPKIRSEKQHREQDKSDNFHYQKLPFICEAMREHDVVIGCLQETRLPGQDMVVRKLGDTKLQYTLLYSGEATKHEHGVGILMRNDLVEGIDVIRYISPRIMYVLGVFKGQKLAVFSVYAPTNVADERQKEQFYDDLERASSEVPAGYTKMFNGDWNARIGVMLTNEERVFRGEFTVREDQNDNGFRLQHFATAQGLIICNSMFRKKLYGTWRGPRGAKGKPHRDRWHTLDYCLIAKEAAKQVVDCGISLTIEAYSDHIPVVLKLYCDHASSGTRRRPNVAQRHSKRPDVSEIVTNELFRLAVGAAYDEKAARITATQATPLQYHQHSFIANSIIDESPEFHPPRVGRRNADWFDDNYTEIGGLLAARKATRLTYLSNRGNNEHKEAYRRAQVKVKRVLQQMKNRHWEQVAARIQQAADSQNAKVQFELMKLTFESLSHGSGGITAIAKLDGTIVKQPAEVLSRVTEHFQALFNQESIISDRISEYLPEQADICHLLERRFDIMELLIAIAMAAKDKSPGTDNRPIEFEQYAASDAVADALLEIVNDVLEGVVPLPKEWKDVIISVLFKKGIKTDCNNYRGISLICHFGKVVERMIENRLRPFTERYGCGILPESQYGFRNSRSTVDMMFVSRVTAAYCRENQQNLISVYIDLTKAYDKVDRGLLWIILERIGVPANLVSMIRQFHEGAMARVKMQSELSAEFLLNFGLKQGSVFSPLLFNIFFGVIVTAMKKRFAGRGLRLRYRPSDADDVTDDIFDIKRFKGKKVQAEKCSTVLIQELLFADDSKLTAENPVMMQEMLDIADEVISAFGQEISVKKTEIMVGKAVAGGQVQAPKIFIKGTELNVVTTFKYIGGTESDDCSMIVEGKIRRQRMHAAFSANWVRIFGNCAIRLSTKLRVYVTMVLTNGTYGCEAWTITKEEIEKFDRCQYQFLLRIFGYRRIQHKSYLALIEEAAARGVPILTMECLVRSRRLQYFGHVYRMDDSRLPKIALLSECLIGTRHPNVHEYTYRRCLKEDIKKFQINGNVKALALHRCTWNRLVNAGKLHFMEVWKTAEQAAHLKRLTKRGESDRPRSVMPTESLPVEPVITAERYRLPPMSYVAKRIAQIRSETPSDL